MTESMQVALAGVIDRCASPEPEPSFFGRLPEEVQPRKDIKAGPKFLLAVLDRLSRGRAETDATDGQLAAACGVSINTIYRWLDKLSRVGLIERVNRTCRRVIRLLFRFRSAATPPRNGGSQLPPGPGDTSPRTVGNLPQNGGEPPPKAGDTSKEKERKPPRAPAASSRPRDVATPPPAKTTDTPPTPARPPLIEARRSEAEAIDARDSALRARWEALPAADRAAIEAEVRAADPMLAAFPPMFRANCLAAMGARPGVSSETSETRAIPAVTDPAPPVEVLPTDRELGSLKFLADATNPFMRLFARVAIRDAGRDDLFRAPERKPAGEPPKGLPAGS